MKTSHAVVFDSLGSLSSCCWAVALFPLGGFLAAQQLDVPANSGALPLFSGSSVARVLVIRTGTVSPRGALMVVTGL